MPNRPLLRRHIIAAWHHTIDAAYSRRLINSERGLQVHFCHALLSQFGEHERRIFVEPCFVARDGQVRSPDVVVCHSRSIIGVIELKYLPRGNPRYDKDLKTLKWFHSGADSLTLSNERYRGVDDTSLKEYALAPDALLCWAGICENEPADLELQARALGTRFLSLYAVTAQGRLPTVHPPLESAAHVER